MVIDEALLAPPAETTTGTRAPGVTPTGTATLIWTTLSSSVGALPKYRISVAGTTPIVTPWAPVGAGYGPEVVRPPSVPATVEGPEYTSINRHNFTDRSRIVRRVQGQILVENDTASPAARIGARHRQICRGDV